MAIDQRAIRAWWSAKQGLDGSLAGKSPAQVLERSGWARSVGGVGPYLTLFSRAGTSREAADAAVAKLEIHELPSARGCTYVLPASDFALGLKVAQGCGDEADMKTARKLGATDAEIDKLCDALVKALEKEPLDPDGLRQVLGSKVRNFGPEGQKKGMTTTLPLALGRLQVVGEIRRIPANGRLDQQRYRYTVWKPNPLKKLTISAEEANTELARKYFGWIGPASIAEFRWFSGLGVKAATAAVEPLKLAALDDRLMLPADLDALKSFKVPKDPQYALVSSLDAINQHRRDIKALLDEEDAGKAFFGGKVNSGLMDLPSHAILDRGRIVGLWEFDPAKGAIVWSSFVKKNKALEEAVRKTEEYVHKELGDAKSFSLDTPKSRAPRLAALAANG
jgi:hypothetical protein